jgi:hypothetical protein
VSGVEWKAHAFGGKGLSGITVITRNAAGAITHLAAHHRPLGEALKFSAEIGRRLQGVIDASHFLQAEDPSRTEIILQDLTRVARLAALPLER